MNEWINVSVYAFYWQIIAHCGRAYPKIPVKTYEQLCNEEKQINIHKRCIISIAIQMYKIKNQNAPNYLVELFNIREMAHSLRNHNQFAVPSFNTITYGRKSFVYYGAKLWNNLPNEIKESNSLTNFKTALTNWIITLESLNQIDFL